MKRSGSRKWLLVVGVLAVVIAFGAVACGNGSHDDSCADCDQRVSECGQAEAADRAKDRPGLRALVEQRRDALQDRNETQSERREALLANLRDQMTEEDQALFDQLKADIEEVRGALTEDRQELADTLKELRALADKYLGLDTEQDDAE